MASRSEHIEQARLNRALARYLATAPVSAEPTLTVTAVQWSTVTAFYSAVHAVEAHFAQLGTHHRTHAQRERAMDRDTGIPIAVTILYRELKAWSLSARYDGRRFTGQYVTTNVLPRLDTLLDHFRL